MGLLEELPAGDRILLDTSTVIYFIERHDRFGPVVRPLFEAIAGGERSAYVSLISLIEVLIIPLKADDAALAEQYRKLLTDTEALTTVGVDLSVAEHAATVRARHGLRTPDALIVGAAIATGCTHVVTNDRRLSVVQDFRTIIVADYTG